MPKQLPLIKDPRKNTKLWWIRKQSTYGGSMNYRKVARPFDSKKLTHAVFKAKLGRSIWFTRSSRSIEALVRSVSERYRVTIKDLAINRDHIHILFYTKRRDDHVDFIRLFATEMGRKYKKIKEKVGVPAGPLWVQRPFTRLVGWGRRSLAGVINYLRKNRDEAMGFIEYQPRRHRLSAFLEKWKAQAFNSG